MSGGFRNPARLLNRSPKARRGGSRRSSYFIGMEPAMEPSRITRIYRNAVRLFAAMKSENIGGLVSMAGSCLFLLGGDSAGIVIALSFLAAEIILTRYGHTRAGYSAGGLLFSFGDALAMISVVAFS